MSDLRAHGHYEPVPSTSGAGTSRAKLTEPEPAKKDDHRNIDIEDKVSKEIALLRVRYEVDLALKELGSEENLHRFHSIQLDFRLESHRFTEVLCTELEIIGLSPIVTERSPSECDIPSFSLSGPNFRPPLITITITKVSPYFSNIKGKAHLISSSSRFAKNMYRVQLIFCFIKKILFDSSDTLFNIQQLL